MAHRHVAHFQGQGQGTAQDCPDEYDQNCCRHSRISCLLSSLGSLVDTTLKHRSPRDRSERSTLAAPSRPALSGSSIPPPACPPWRDGPAPGPSLLCP